MKKLVLLAIPVLFIGMTAGAQLTPQPLKEIMELKMPGSITDEKPGTRGASVAWHPVQHKYYASFAGNAGFPMGVFDQKGKLLSSNELKTMADTRGLWYDPVTKQVCGNSYNDGGWFSYKLDIAGIPSDINYITDGMNQPNAQSVGTYIPLVKRVIFMQGNQVYLYNNKGELQDSLLIHFGRTKTGRIEEDEDLESIEEDYNSTTVIYTGIKGQELGFLNVIEQQVELYDSKTGFLSRILSLPETASPEYLFNFSYANGIYWLFNIELRKWFGYKPGP